MLAPETGAKVSAIDSVHFHDPNPTDSSVNFFQTTCTCIVSFTHKSSILGPLSA